jgi:apolipoprotein N-acyltransferase
MPQLLRPGLATLAGAAVALAFEPYAIVWLVPVGVAGLTLLLTGLSPARGFVTGVVFGTAFMLVLLPWLQIIGPDAWVSLSLLEGLFYGLLGLGGVLVRRLPWWPVWTASLWVGVEALRSTVPFGGFPWGRLSFATADTPAADLFAYVGPAGTTFVVALVGTALAWAVLQARREPVKGVAAVVAPCLLAGSGAVLSPGVPTPTEQPRRALAVAAVQGNVPGEGMDAFAERRVVLDNHVQATYALANRIANGAPRPDLVVWPENSTDIDPFADPSVRAAIQGAVDAVGVPVLVGAMVSGKDPRNVYNQGIVWEPGTGPAERYSKTHPVPFGEYVPFRNLFTRFITRLDMVPRDMVPGHKPGLLSMGSATVGDVICFEVAYDRVVRDVVEGGADVVVVQTNNATYMGTGQIEQQFAIARLRAIETNRYVVVAATNGVSGIIAPDGHVVDRAPVRSQAVLERTVPVYAHLAPAMTWAPVTEFALTLLAVFSTLLGALLHYRRPRRGRASEDAGRPAVAAGRGTP